MKTKLLFIALMLISVVGYSQTQPTVHNATFDDIPKSSGSDCACSGWINKSLGDQGESSTKNGDDVIKFDNVESDALYQEVAVEANTNYTVNLDYWYSSTTTTTEHIEIIILKGSAYKLGYTPVYDVPADAAQDNFGYDSLTVVDDTNNHVARTTVTVPDNTDQNAITELTFSTGAETSIAIFIRAVGPYDAASHGDSDDDKGWMNGDTEVRVDNFALVNVGATASVNDVLASKFNTFPNPANDVVQIATSLEINKVEMYNVLGKKVTTSFNQHNNNVDISSLSKGIYVLKITSGQSTITKKIIKE